MAEFFNPLDIDKWRNLIASFDIRRQEFFAALDDMKQKRGATPALERERQTLLTNARKIEKDIDGLMSTMNTVRNWISNISKTIGLGNTQTMGSLGLGPLIIGAGIGAATIIVRSITDWLKKTAEYKARNDHAALLVKAGASPQQIIEAEKGQKIQPKIFGMESGGLKWVFAIGALVLLGPIVFKQIEKRL